MLLPARSVMSAIQHCAREVTRTVHRTLGAALDTIRVLVHQLPPNQWIVGDMTRAELDAPSATTPTG